MPLSWHQVDTSQCSSVHCLRNIFRMFYKSMTGFGIFYTVQLKKQSILMVVSKTWLCHFSNNCLAFQNDELNLQYKIWYFSLRISLSSWDFFGTRQKIWSNVFKCLHPFVQISFTFLHLPSKRQSFLNCHHICQNFTKFGKFGKFFVCFFVNFDSLFWIF